VSLVSTIVLAAYREGNILPINSTPTSAEQTEAVDALNRFVKVQFGTRMGEQLSDWLVPQPQRTASVAANYPQLPYPANADFLALSTPMANDATIEIWPYPPKNSRIVFGLVAATVFFPEQPDDGSRMAIVSGSGAGAGDSGNITAALTLDGNGRTIEGENQQVYAGVTDPFPPREWFYRADLGDWTAVVPLTYDDDFLFPADLDDYFVTALAIRLAPRHGKAVSAETQAAFKEARTLFLTRYKQSGVTVYKSGDIPNSFQAYRAGQWFGG
jgi:hypothetical protein